MISRNLGAKLYVGVFPWARCAVAFCWPFERRAHDVQSERQKRYPPIFLGDPMINLIHLARRLFTQQPREKKEHILVCSIAVLLAAAGLVDWLVSHNRDSSTTGHNRDATAFISILIVIYTVFLTVYGTILPQLVDPKQARGQWIWFMIVLTVLAVGVDLWRVQNSLGDLFKTTNRTLTPGQLDDASFEFVRYWFYGNVVVIGLLLITLAWRPHRPVDERGDSRTDPPAPAGP
jgi:hypothetical protein